MSNKNIAASVKARLKVCSDETGQVYQDVLRNFAMERFLYRLSQSDYAGKFILKGALLFMAWENTYQRRTTLDIDLLGLTENSLEHLEAVARSVCVVDVENDGIHYDPESIRLQRIKEDADYEGVRIKLFAFLENSRIPVQVDIGFGDTLVPDAIAATLPTLLDFPATVMKCYHHLTVIAEKFEAMIQLGNLNSRMKDFYAVWNIIQHEDIVGAELQKACRATFDNRHTPFNLDDYFFSEGLPQSPKKQLQWNAFIRKQGLETIAPPDFETVVRALQEFFLPMVQQQIAGETFSMQRRSNQMWK